MAPTTRAVIFDLDGTLIHSLPDLTSALNRTLALHARAPLSEAEVGPMVGDGAGALVERAFSARGGLPQGEIAPLLHSFMSDYERNATVQTKPWQGVEAALQCLRDDGLVLAVCTNKPSQATHEILAALGIDHYFAVVVGGDDTPALKPDRAHIHAVLHRLSVNHDEAVMVGDSINDVLAAKAAHVPCIVVSFGYAREPIAELGADRVIHHFDELCGAVAEMG